MSDMYNITVLRTWKKNVKFCYELDSNPRSCACWKSAVHTALPALMSLAQKLQYMITVLPGGWWRTSGAGPAAPPPPLTRHDVASPSINIDLFEAEIRGEASLGGADVAANSGLIEEQPATWKVAGWCAIDTDESRHCATAVDRQAGIRACPGRHHSHKQ